MSPCPGLGRLPRLVLPVLVLAWAGAGAGISDAGGFITIQTVFQAGQDGYHTYRIPALLVNTRMQGDFRGARGIAASTDGGATWSAITQEEQLPCPLCQGSLSR